MPKSGVITGKGEAEIFESGMNELGGNDGEWVLDCMMEESGGEKESSGEVGPSRDLERDIPFTFWTAFAWRAHASDPERSHIGAKRDRLRSQVTNRCMDRQADRVDAMVG